MGIFLEKHYPHFWKQIISTPSISLISWNRWAQKLRQCWRLTRESGPAPWGRTPTRGSWSPWSRRSPGTGSIEFLQLVKKRNFEIERQQPATNLFREGVKLQLHEEVADVKINLKQLSTNEFNEMARASYAWINVGNLWDFAPLDKNLPSDRSTYPEWKIRSLVSKLNI